MRFIHLLALFLLILTANGLMSLTDTPQSPMTEVAPVRETAQSWEEFVKNFNVNKKAEEGKSGDGKDECADMHPECKNHADLCKKDTYSVMMLHVCPKTCTFCEARKHFPDSGLACTDHTTRCIRKSFRDKCKTDEETKKVCPWTCGICT